MTCENKDVMEGIMHMEIKYKNAGMIFECFHNRGHQRPIFLEKDQRITTHKMMYKGEEIVKPLRKQ